MEGFVELGTIAELSLTLGGFAAIVAMFRGGSIHNWHPRARLGFWLIVSYCFGSLFFSLLPSLLGDMGTSSWAPPMVALSIFLILVTVLAIHRNLQLTAAGMPPPTRVAWVLGASVSVAAVAVLLWGSAGGLGGPSYRLYHLGVVACLLLACVSFVAVLRLREPAA